VSWPRVGGVLFSPLAPVRLPRHRQRGSKGQSGHPFLFPFFPTKTEGKVGQSFLPSFPPKKSGSRPSLFFPSPAAHRIGDSATRLTGLFFLSFSCLSLALTSRRASGFLEPLLVSLGKPFLFFSPSPDANYVGGGLWVRPRRLQPIGTSDVYTGEVSFFFPFSPPDKDKLQGPGNCLLLSSLRPWTPPVPLMAVGRQEREERSGRVPPSPPPFVAM